MYSQGARGECGREGLAVARDALVLVQYISSESYPGKNVPGVDATPPSPEAKVMVTPREVSAMY